MTICLSIIHGENKIIALCDTLARDNNGQEFTNFRKFSIIKIRNLLCLCFGGAEEGDLKKYLDAFNKIAKEGGSVSSYSELIAGELTNLAGGSWEVHVCGFDEKKPKIYSIKEGKSKGPSTHQISCPNILRDFFKRKETKNALSDLPEDLDEAISHLKRLFEKAISYENTINKTQPLTGGDGINILVVHSEKIDWLEPRFYENREIFKYLQ